MKNSSKLPDLNLRSQQSLYIQACSWHLWVCVTFCKIFIDLWILLPSYEYCYLAMNILSTRLEPIVLQKLPIFLCCNSSDFRLFCSLFAQYLTTRRHNPCNIASTEHKPFNRSPTSTTLELVASLLDSQLRPTLAVRSTTWCTPFCHFPPKKYMWLVVIM